MGWPERSTGISPTITNFCLRTCSAGSTASTLISPDIDEQIEARLARFMWKAFLDTSVLIAEDLGAAPNTPGARAGGVLHQKERSQPTPVAVARCGSQHVGGGCCASS
jgi:hypothetical protein